MEVRVGHSPDSDDAFMFYALAADKLQTGEYRFSHRLEDIETLNRKALGGEYEVTALSIHAYAYVADRYALLSSGASMGDSYGPIVVSKEAVSRSDLRGKEIAVPGTMTTAYLVLKLFQEEFIPICMPFDKIMDAVARRKVDAGLLIHEGQLTYAGAGLYKVLDLGEWWNDTTKLPLPLGGNGIRRDLGAERIRDISQLIKESIRYALEHRGEALRHALSFARGLNEGDADRFVSMYVNSRTLDYGQDGRAAVQLLMDKAFEFHLLPSPVHVDFVD